MHTKKAARLIGRLLLNSVLPDYISRLAAS